MRPTAGSRRAASRGSSSPSTPSPSSPRAPRSSASASPAPSPSQFCLAPGIALVPQRNPVYTAKEVAAVDWLSNGRLDFGVGVGWLAEEFEACGVPFERRGERTRDYLAAMRALW